MSQPIETRDGVLQGVEEDGIRVSGDALLRAWDSVP